METKVDQLHERLAAHEASVNAKLDQIIEGQATGKQDRHEMKARMGGIEASISDMRPHVETVATAKNAWKAVLVLTGIAGSIAGGVVVAWGYIKPILLHAIGRGG